MKQRAFADIVELEFDIQYLKNIVLKKYVKKGTALFWTSTGKFGQKSKKIVRNRKVGQ